MALEVAAGAWIIPASFCLAGDEKPATPTAAATAPKHDESAAPTSKDGEKAEESESSGKGRSVQLHLVIGGLGKEGCDVEIKPGNASCRFKKQKCHVTADGKATLRVREIELRGVDRNCTFAITMSEKGQSPKTVYRGFRMAAPDDDSSSARTESFTCFMSSPSKVAGLAREGRIIR